MDCMVHPDDGGRDNREIKKVLMILKFNESQISNLGAAQNQPTVQPRRTGLYNISKFSINFTIYKYLTELCHV